MKCTFLKYMHTHTKNWVNRLTVPVASLIKQWQLYYRPDKPDCAERERGQDEKKRGRKKGSRQRDRVSRRLKKGSQQNRPGRKNST